MLDFDFDCALGGDEWQVSQTPEGRPIYSTKEGVSPGVVVEFLKCEW